jgi:IS605 OrfB family transposase
VTKQIVQSAKTLNYDTIAIEDLKDIRQQNRELKKSFRARLNSWPFDQFREFLTYKALAEGIGLVVVDSRYTSQRCSRCGHVYKPQRNGNEFHCVNCGYQNHADLNASFNISKNWVAENPNLKISGSGRHVCPDRAEVQPAYCSGSGLITSHRPCAGGS